MPFGQRPGRNNPGTTKWLFGPSVWLRGLIKPAPGQALAYIDWDSQEVAIAAALSGDPAMLVAIRSGDPYMAFAKLAGLAPEDATKASHPLVREQCKQCVLGTNYGMQATSLAYRIGGSVADAERLLRALAKAFPVFSQWVQDTIYRGMLTGWLSSVYGWPLRAGPDTRATALRNYPMQSNGAEMLRIACCLATERGVKVCAPVHDAILIEAPTSDIKDAVKAAQQAMAEASGAVLGGHEIGSSAELVAWPGRYADPHGRGAVMWDRVNTLLSKFERAQETS
jgi:DNA polymerase I-like protein with 3'-5' exonuclease and polymerase domains